MQQQQQQQPAIWRIRGAEKTEQVSKAANGARQQGCSLGEASDQLQSAM